MTLNKTRLSILLLLVTFLAIWIYSSPVDLALKTFFIVLWFGLLAVILTVREIKITVLEEETIEEENEF